MICILECCCNLSERVQSTLELFKHPRDTSVVHYNTCNTCTSCICIHIYIYIYIYIYLYIYVYIRTYWLVQNAPLRKDVRLPTTITFSWDAWALSPPSRRVWSNTTSKHDEWHVQKDGRDCGRLTLSNFGTPWIYVSQVLGFLSRAKLKQFLFGPIIPYLPDCDKNENADFCSITSFAACSRPARMTSRWKRTRPQCSFCRMPDDSIVYSSFVSEFIRVLCLDDWVFVLCVICVCLFVCLFVCLYCLCRVV